MMSSTKWAATSHLSGCGLVLVQPLKEFRSKSRQAMADNVVILITFNSRGVSMWSLQCYFWQEQKLAAAREGQACRQGFASSTSGWKKGQTFCADPVCRR